MKIQSKFVNLLVLGAGIGWILTISGCARQKREAVTIQDDRIVIHPGTKLSEEDERMLNEVLKQYDTKLYRVETYENGELTKKLGELNLDEETASGLAKSKAGGLNDRVVYITAGPSTKKMPPRSVTEEASGKELIKQVKPILEKYSKQ